MPSSEHRGRYTNTHSRYVKLFFSLLDIKEAIDQAGPIADHLTKAQLQVFEARYQNILDDGYTANPLSACPAHAENKCGQRKKTKPRNLLERLRRAPAGSSGFHVRLQCPLRQQTGRTGHPHAEGATENIGLFRSAEGARAFCRICSYISTARKNALGTLDAIARAFAGNPFVPDANTT